MNDVNFLLICKILVPISLGNPNCKIRSKLNGKKFYLEKLGNIKKIKKDSPRKLENSAYKTLRSKLSFF